MKKIIIISLLLHFSTLLSQNKSNKISVTFKDLNKKEIIKLIEKKTNYRFFYIDEWIDDKKITNTLNNLNIHEVLDIIFNDTSINYFVLKKK